VGINLASTTMFASTNIDWANKPGRIQPPDPAPILTGQEVGYHFPLFRQFVDGGVDLFAGKIIDR
jgi:hypothetical protein